MAAEIKTLKLGTTTVYPQTVTSAVWYADDISLAERIESIDQDIQAYTRMMQALGATGFASTTNLANTDNMVV